MKACQAGDDIKEGKLKMVEEGKVVLKGLECEAGGKIRYVRGKGRK